MSTPVVVPEAPLFPLDAEQVREGLRVLRYQADTAAAEPLMDFEALLTNVHEFVEAQPVESLGAAAGLFSALTARLCAPDVAGRLPQGPYRSAGEPWNMSAVSLLPRVAVLAGEEAVTAALTGTLDLAALPDATRTACTHVASMAALSASQWTKGTHRKRRDRDAATMAVLETFNEYREDRWPGFDADASWRTNLGHEPFRGSEFSHKEMIRFGSVSSPLRITDRYPSALKGGESKFAGSPTERGRTVRVMRSVWMNVLQILLEDLLTRLSADVHGFPGGEATALRVPPHRVADPLVRDITLELSAGLPFGAFSKTHGTLPAPTEPFPTSPEALVEVTVERDPSEDVKVTVTLPSRDLPSAEDAAVGVMRLFADALLTTVQGLTPSAQETLTLWRDNGSEPYGVRGFQPALSTQVDMMVASMDRSGVQWVASPPAEVVALGTKTRS
jgi:hypothetical protein